MPGPPSKAGAAKGLVGLQSSISFIGVKILKPCSQMGVEPRHTIEATSATARDTSTDYQNRQKCVAHQKAHADVHRAAPPRLLPGRSPGYARGFCGGPPIWRRPYARHTAEQRQGPMRGAGYQRYHTDKRWSNLPSTMPVWRLPPCSSSSLQSIPAQKPGLVRMTSSAASSTNTIQMPPINRVLLSMSGPVHGSSARPWRSAAAPPAGGADIQRRVKSRPPPCPGFAARQLVLRDLLARFYDDLSFCIPPALHRFPPYRGLPSVASSSYNRLAFRYL